MTIQKQNDGKQLAQDFEKMVKNAELKALSNLSLQQPLSDPKYKRMIELKKELLE